MSERSALLEHKKDNKTMSYTTIITFGEDNSVVKRVYEQPVKPEKPVPREKIKLISTQPGSNCSTSIPVGGCLTGCGGCWYAILNPGISMTSSTSCASTCGSTYVNGLFGFLAGATTGIYGTAILACFCVGAANTCICITNKCTEKQNAFDQARYRRAMATYNSDLQRPQGLTMDTSIN